MSITTTLQKSDFPIASLALLIVMYVARNAFPYMFYPTVICMFAFALYTLFTQRAICRPCRDAVRILHPILILLLIEIIAFCVTLPHFGRFQMNYLKEIVFVTVFIYLIVSHLRHIDHLKRLSHYLTVFFYGFSVVIAILGILKFFYAPAFISEYVFYGKPMTIYGSSLVRDYNFYSLFLLNGLVLGTFAMLRNPIKKHQILFIIGLICIMTAMMLAGSRRLDLSALILIVLLALLLVFPKLYRRFFAIEQRKTLMTYFLLILVDWGLIFALFMLFPTSEKHPVASALGFNTEKLDQNVHFVGHRFNSMIGFNLIMTTPKSGEGFDDLTESRKTRWEEALDVFCQYDPLYKVTGKGFRYLQDFQKTNLEYNHPHFQLLSIALYSGLIGAGLFLFVLIYTTILYFKYFKMLYDYMFLFAVNLMFGTFSFTDAIGATFFIFTLIIPLMYHYFYKKMKQQPVVL